jgi:hypothetical protein
MPRISEVLRDRELNIIQYAYLMLLQTWRKHDRPLGEGRIAVLIDIDRILKEIG